MRIVFITTEFVTEERSFDGGLSNYLYKVALSLKRMGHEPIVIVRSNKEEQILHDDIEVHRVFPKPTFWYKFFDKITFFKYLPVLNSILFSYWANKKVKQIHKLNTIDVIQYTSVLSTNIIQNRKIPSVVRVSSDLVLYDEVMEFNFITVRQRQEQILQTISFKKANSLFCPSDLMARYIEGRLRRKVRVIETPSYFVNQEMMNNDSFVEVKSVTGNNRYLLYFGRLGKWKGTIDIADILFDLLEKYPDIFFVFVGKDKHYQNRPVIDYIIEKAQHHKDRIIYISNITHNKLFPIIENAYAVVLPSHIENLSNAGIEAMSFGKLVVGTEGSSFEQIIKDGFSGFLCEVGNSKSLFEKVDEALNLSSEEKKVIENNAKQRIKLLHPDIVVKELVDFYKEIIDR